MTELPPHVPDVEVIEQFMAAMREQQIDIDENIIADGKLHRYHVAGDKGRARNAWALLHVDEHPVGKFGCNKRYPGGDKFTWTMKGTRPLTPEERIELKARAAARAAQRQAEDEINNAAAAQRALAIYEGAQPVTEHPYLTLKGVPSSPKLRVGNWYYIDEETGEEILVSDCALIVPMMDPAKRIHSLQAILDDGEGGIRKQYLKHGVKEGHFVSIGAPRDNIILIAEGLATGLSLWQCTAHAVIVAFDAGNLLSVSKEVRRVFPDHTLLLCADNDAWTEKPVENPGVYYARLAAAAVNALVVFPEFLNTDSKPTDFNDLHQLEGEQPVRDFIERALVPPVEAPETTLSDGAIAAAQGCTDKPLEGTNNPAMDALNPDVAHVLRTSPPDMFFLPNDNFASVPVAAERIFSHLSSTGEMYRRGNAIAEIKDNQLLVLTPTAFRARLNKRGRKTMAFKVAQHGDVYPSEKHCSEDIARVLLSASEVDLLHEVKLIVSNPLLVEIDGALEIAQPGYNRSSGVLVTGNAAVYDVLISDAVSAILDLLQDFKFASAGDRSRGIAGVIGPALRMGGFLSGNATVDMVEADDSQAGKGTKCELTHAIYGEKPYSVVQKQGGVGSYDESLSAALNSASPFITLDNLRGALDSILLEASITPVSSDKRVAVRVPYRGEIRVDISRIIFQATSNGFSSTCDLANRLLVTRLIKQPGDYQYTEWGDGPGLIAHVEKHSVYLLSCVQAVVRHWHAAGKPINPTTHTFKQWIGALDWIVQNIFGGVPLLDGHAGAAQRIANTGLSWLRAVGNAAVKDDQVGRELRASDIRLLCDRNGCMPDGVKLDWDDGKAERAIGRIMAGCFVHGDTVAIDSIVVERIERKPANNNWKPTRFYVFNRPA